MLFILCVFGMFDHLKYLFLLTLLNFLSNVPEFQLFCFTSLGLISTFTEGALINLFFFDHTNLYLILLKVANVSSENLLWFSK